VDLPPPTPSKDNDDILSRLAHRTMMTPNNKVTPGLVSVQNPPSQPPRSLESALGNLGAENSAEDPGTTTYKTCATLLDLCRNSIPFFAEKETRNPALKKLGHLPATIDFEIFRNSDDGILFISALFPDGKTDLVKTISTVCKKKTLLNRLGIVMGVDVRFDLEIANVLETQLAFELLEELHQRSWDDIPHLLLYKESLKLEEKLKHTAEGRLILEVLQDSKKPLATATSAATADAFVPEESTSAVTATAHALKESTRESEHTAKKSKMPVTTTTTTTTLAAIANVLEEEYTDQSTKVVERSKKPITTTTTSAATTHVPEEESTKTSTKIVKPTDQGRIGSTLLRETRSSSGKRVSGRRKDSKPDFRGGRS